METEDGAVMEQHEPPKASPLLRVSGNASGETMVNPDLIRFIGTLRPVRQGVPSKGARRVCSEESRDD
jgi:hypothetical protein